MSNLLTVNVDDFADGLAEIIPVKIQEIVDSMDHLEEEKKRWLSAIEKCYKRGEINTFAVYFWTLYAELSGHHFFTFKKQLRYWLDLYAQLPNSFVPIQQEVKYENDAAKIAAAKAKSIEDFYPLPLRGHGSRLMGRCPFHEEQTASFVIYTDQNTYHCFGACNSGGDVIDYIKKLKGLDFAGALAFLS